MLNANEYAIMARFWKEDGPVTRMEVIRKAKITCRSSATQMIFCNLVEKGYLKIVGETKKGKTYCANKSYRDYLMEAPQTIVPDKPLPEIIKDCNRIYKPLKAGNALRGKEN